MLAVAPHIADLIAHAYDGPLRVEPRAVRSDTRCAHCKLATTGEDGLCTRHAANEAYAVQSVLEAWLVGVGFQLRYVDFCEDGDTPGFLGYYAGVTSHDRKDVKISTKKTTGHGIKARTLFEIVEILVHECKHVVDPEWDCGNRPVK